jgi:hypothetical protein
MANPAAAIASAVRRLGQHPAPANFQAGVMASSARPFRPRLGTDVFPKAELTAGAKHALHLGQGLRDTGDRAERQRREDSVERSIGEGQALGPGLHQLYFQAGVQLRAFVLAQS